MLRRSRFFVAVPFAALLVTPSLARAADPTAESLYEEGRHAAAEKNWTLACTKFRDSQTREPAPGTLLNLADCEENLGQLVQAEVDFSAAAQAFKKGDSRAAYAKKRAAGIDARVPHLAMHFVAGSPSDAHVERDGIVVDPSAIGATTPVDPGAHVIVVHSSGRTDVRSELRLAEGETKQIELSVGAPLAVVSPAPDAPVATTPAPAVAAVPVAATSPASGSDHPKPSQASNPLVGVGVVGMAVGGAGIAFGLIAGAITLSKSSTANAHCLNGCDPTGLDAESSGKTWSTISTVSVVAGAVVGAAGLVLVLVNLAPSGSNDSNNASASASRITVSPTNGGGALGWSGTF